MPHASTVTVGAIVSAKHQDPEFRVNARIVRQQVAKARRIGADVNCWRCGGLIDPEQTYDVGHIHADGGHARSNLAPEHRYKSGACQGNRAAGGRLGAQIVNATKTTNRQTTRGLLPW